METLKEGNNEDEIYYVIIRDFFKKKKLCVNPDVAVKNPVSTNSDTIILSSTKYK